MAKHYNPSISERAQRQFNFKGDSLTDEITGPVAVIPIQPFVRNLVRATSTATAALTAFTTPSDKDYFLTGLTLGITKDAACDNSTVQVAVTVAGVQTIIVDVPTQTLTAQSTQVPVMFNPPIRLDRNQPIQVFGTFTVGTMRKNLCLYGYTEETISN